MCFLVIMEQQKKKLTGVTDKNADPSSRVLFQFDSHLAGMVALFLTSYCFCKMIRSEVASREKEKIVEPTVFIIGSISPLAHEQIGTKELKAIMDAEHFLPFLHPVMTYTWWRDIAWRRKRFLSVNADAINLPGVGKRQRVLHCCGPSSKQGSTKQQPSYYRRPAPSTSTRLCGTSNGEFVVSKTHTGLVMPSEISGEIIDQVTPSGGRTHLSRSHVCGQYESQ